MRRSLVLRLAPVKSRFGLTAAELAKLDRNGFVVPSRLAFPSYAVAYHEIYQSELPLYVTVDSIFHTVFATNDEILATVEGRRLSPLLDDALRKLHGALRAAAPAYPPAVTADLDLYLSVARGLLAGSYVDSVGEPQPAARTLMASAMNGEAMEARHHGTMASTASRQVRTACTLARFADGLATSRAWSDGAV